MTALVRPLSPGQLDVVQLIAKARANKEIASELGISVHTVKDNVRAAMDRTGTRNRVELALWAVAQRAAA